MSDLSLTQIEEDALAAGWPAQDVPTIAAIAEAESSGNPNAVQAGQPYATEGWGLTQITPGNSVPGVGTDQQLLNPVTNLEAALQKFQSAGGFSPWTTYPGVDSQYLAAAQAALPGAEAAAGGGSSGSNGNSSNGGGSGLSLSNLAADAQRVGWLFVAAWAVVLGLVLLLGKEIFGILEKAQQAKEQSSE